MMFLNNYPMIFAAVTALVGVSAAREATSIVIDAVNPPPIEAQAIGPDTVMAGQDVLIAWQIIKRTACPGENSRVWDGKDGFHMTEAAMPTSLPAGNEWVTYPIQTGIPSLAPPGDLRLSIVGWYQCPGSDRHSFTLGPVVMKVVEGAK